MLVAAVIDVALVAGDAPQGYIAAMGALPRGREDETGAATQAAEGSEVSHDCYCNRERDNWCFCYLWLREMKKNTLWVAHWEADLTNGHAALH